MVQEKFNSVTEISLERPEILLCFLVVLFFFAGPSFEPPAGFPGMKRSSGGSSY